MEFPRRIGQWHWTNRITIVETESLRLPFGAIDAYVFKPPVAH